MKISTYIEQKAADLAFALEHGLTISRDDPYTMEQKDMMRGFETKVRRVRTQAGVERFGQPIGSIITSKGKRLKNITLNNPVHKGWDLVSGKGGAKYDVGKAGKGKGWAAYRHNDRSKPVVTAASEEELFSSLDKFASTDKVKGGKASDKKVPKGKAKPTKEKPTKEKAPKVKPPEKSEAEETPKKDKKKKVTGNAYGVGLPDPKNYDVAAVVEEAESVIQRIEKVESRIESGESSAKDLDHEWLGSYLNRLLQILDADEPWELEDVYESLNERLMESKLRYSKPSQGLSRRADGASFDYPEELSESELEALEKRMASEYELKNPTGDNATVIADATSAFDDYIFESYAKINRYLRTGSPNDPDDDYYDDEEDEAEVKRHLDEEISKMKKALWAFESKEEMYSARHLPVGLMKNMQLGDVMKDEAFVSTSMRTDWAYKEQIRRNHGMSGNEGLGTGKIAAVHIKIPKGSPGAYIDTIGNSYEEPQWEFLLPPGTSFKIVGITETPDGPVYEVEAMFEGRSS